MEISIDPFLLFTTALARIDRGRIKWQSNRDLAMDMDRFCTVNMLRLRQVEGTQCRGLVSNSSLYSGAPR